MTRTRALLIAIALMALTACGEQSKFKDYDGPKVTRVLLFKSERKLYLMHQNQELAKYDVGLGFAPEGHKEIEGDGRTPEGHYLIDKRNPNSKFHLSVGISYPNPADVARAEALGKSPGGDIFIHGRGPTYWKGAPVDWTFGCIAVTDDEIERIYAMVADGTPISIYPSRADMEAELTALREDEGAARMAVQSDLPSQADVLVGAPLVQAGSKTVNSPDPQALPQSAAPASRLANAR